MKINKSPNITFRPKLPQRILEISTTFCVATIHFFLKI